ncbi:hypothetical protein [Streptomyces bottropensis]|uniref:hypothetical protein n=1 Tax=Streptomyces bottropensis TaxID=42235 RepID=UPI003674132D
MPEIPKVPAGWSYNVVPGWPTHSFSNWGRLERVSNVLLPQSFTGIAAAKDGSEDVFLCFVVHQGEVKMSAVMSSYSDVHEGLDQLRRAAPVDTWKQLAIVQMTQWLATTDPEVFTEAARGSGLESALAMDWAEAARGWQAEHQGESALLAVQDAASLPVRRKRNRITREHLEDVAEVYRMADHKGDPPTQAVQKRFSTTHSTAAKWVAQARKQGFLGPARNSRGGEMAPDS